MAKDNKVTDPASAFDEKSQVSNVVSRVTRMTGIDRTVDAKAVRSLDSLKISYGSKMPPLEGAKRYFLAEENLNKVNGMLPKLKSDLGKFTDDVRGIKEAIFAKADEEEVNIQQHYTAPTESNEASVLVDAYADYMTGGAYSVMQAGGELYGGFSFDVSAMQKDTDKVEFALMNDPDCIYDFAEGDVKAMLDVDETKHTEYVQIAGVIADVKDTKAELEEAKDTLEPTAFGIDSEMAPYLSSSLAYETKISGLKEDDLYKMDLNVASPELLKEMAKECGWENEEEFFAAQNLEPVFNKLGFNA